MSRPLYVTIKVLAAELGTASDFSGGGGSLADFLSNKLSPSDTASIAGAKLLEYFCLDDGGGFNGFRRGVDLAVTFLDETLGHRNTEQRLQSLKDLKSVLEDAKDRKPIDDWVRGWYG